MLTALPLPWLSVASLVIPGAVRANGTELQAEPLLHH